MLPNFGPPMQQTSPTGDFHPFHFNSQGDVTPFHSFNSMGEPTPFAQFNSQGEPCLPLNHSGDVSIQAPDPFAEAQARMQQEAAWHSHQARLRNHTNVVDSESKKIDQLPSLMMPEFTGTEEEQKREEEAFLRMSGAARAALYSLHVSEEISTPPSPAVNGDPEETTRNSPAGSEYIPIPDTTAAVEYESDTKTTRAASHQLVRSWRQNRIRR